MYKSVNAEEVSNYMLEAFVKYGKEVEKTVEKCTDKLSKNVKPELKGYSRKNGQLYRTGAYQRGWGVKVIKKPNIYQIKTYNRKKPTLVHLLEFGHNGPIKAKPYPHIQRTELKYLGLLLEALKKELE